MYNPKCCGTKMQKQEILYGQNWQCLECGRGLKTPANGMTKKDIDEYYKKRNEFAKQYFAEIGRKGGAKSRRTLTPEQSRAMTAAREAKRKKKNPDSSV